MILIQNESGLCEGLVNTLNAIYETYENNTDKNYNIYIYKNLINNKKVIQELEELDIKVIDDLSTLDYNDILIINSYGINKDAMQYIKDNKINYVDTTCKYIKDFKEEVISNYNKGKDVLIIKNDYSEIINNWINNNGIIINNIEDLNNLKSKDKILVGYLNPDNELLLDYQNFLKNKFPNNQIDVLDYSCEHYKNLYNFIKTKKDNQKIIIAQKDENIANSINNIKDFINYALESDLKESDKITLIGSNNTTIKELYYYKYLLAFLLYYKNVLKTFQEGQQAFNKSLINKKDNPLINNVLNAINDLNQNGKYIRATLISLGEYLATNKKEQYLNLAYAYELFQTSILIHDDIIDNAKIRRGKSTIPHLICEKYLNNQNNTSYHNDTLKLANSLAICAGDLGFYLANQTIITNYYKHPHFAKIINFYNDIVIRTIKGEIIDVYMPFLNKYHYYESKEEDIMDIYHLKTSWYTIIGPFILGYLLGSGEVPSKLENTLNTIGLAFQIKDDLLGIYGDNKVTGKSNIIDIQEFKQTILYTYVINTEYKDEFLKLYGKKNLNLKEIQKIREILYLSGAYKYACNYLEDLYNTFIEEIDDLEINEEVKDILKGLLIFILEREK